MPKVLPLALLQSLLLVGAQVALKVALERIPPFSWSASFWRETLLCWPLAVSGVCFGACALLWVHILKHFPFSVAYPLVSLSYALGLVAAAVVFHEEVGAAKWVGVALIMMGCVLIAK